MSQDTQPQDTKNEAVEKAPKRNISFVAREAIREGLSNAEALARVKAEFPDANTTVSSIAWYRNDLRKKGENYPSPARPKKEKAPKAKAADAKTDVKAKPSKAKATESAPADEGGFE